MASIRRLPHCLRVALQNTVRIQHRDYSSGNRLARVQLKTYVGSSRGLTPFVCQGKRCHSTSTPRFRCASTASDRSCVVRTAETNSSGDTINVTWDNGATSEFPFAWLRDNCQCSECFHASALARNVLMHTLDVNVKPTEVTVQESGIDVCWSDGHFSAFDSTWLHQRQFTEEGRRRHKCWSPRETRKWSNSEMQNNVPTDTFERITSDDRALYNWLCTMEEDGIFLITGMPTKEGVLKEFASHIAFLRATNYGTLFNVKSKIDVSNLAYTAQTLGLHTDLPYYNYCPGIQMLMCHKQVATIGGENQFSDGFFVAERMRKEFPEHFGVLTTMPVPFIDVGTDAYQFHKLHSTPTISLDDAGQVTRVTYNNQTRDSTFPVSVEMVKPWYQALKMFDSLLYEHAVTLKLQAGDMVCFHNYRVLHGRTGYDALEDGERHLEGGYIDWDELFSRRRVLQAKLGLDL